MYRKVAFVMAAVAALALSYAPANAGGRHSDKVALTATSIGVGAASTAAYFALNDWHWKWDSARHGITATGAFAITTIGCAALSPFVASAVLKRSLSYREAHMLIAGCIIPVVGSWLVDQAYEQHIMWAPDEVAAPKKKWKKHARK
jgi:hypothetical protein